MQDVTGVAHVLGGDGEDRLLDVCVFGRQVLDLVGVGLAIRQCSGEDARVGGDPDDVLIVEQALQFTFLDHGPVQVV